MTAFLGVFCCCFFFFFFFGLTVLPDGNVSVQSEISTKGGVQHGKRGVRSQDNHANYICSEFRRRRRRRRRRMPFGARAKEESAAHPRALALASCMAVSCNSLLLAPKRLEL
ncbi:hypothetical protein FN846DRAFT_253479 [Sphaerosporella brunnea]|uniref:Uncharacterized protein n=1 Tax=Sphaerosporella brunnea TaxID=1250544 RepID=A0A5J5F7J0_9PEZI|nr:hypothetical protein FN846DRAFT_253479 [Sphaerosporella brunnea]